MIIISHRGNHNFKKVENDPRQLPLDKWKCELDLWRIGDAFYLGHDEPQYLVKYEWIRYVNPDILWHAKNLSAMLFIKNELKYSVGFWHQNDDFALTFPDQKIIIYPGKQLTSGAIIMKPELYPTEALLASNPYAICTDYPELYS